MSESTFDLQRHLERAASEGGSLADYARRHGLSPRQLYDYRYLQQTQTSKRVKPHKPKPAFTCITATSDASSLAKVHLANGVVIEIGGHSLGALLPVLKAL